MMFSFVAKRFCLVPNVFMNPNSFWNVPVLGVLMSRLLLLMSILSETERFLMVVEESVGNVW